MNSTPAQPNHKWNADRAGEHPNDDELGRSDFAQQVAKELRGWRQKDSLVVSLNGDWGSGKTTLANYIIHYIEEQAKSCREEPPIVVRFNPWQWSGQDKLLEGFFAQVSSRFRGSATKGLASAKNLARLWDGLKVVTVAGGELAQRLQESITALAASLAAGSGVLSAYISSPQGKQVLSWIGITLLAIAGVCAVYAPVAAKLAAVFRWGMQATPPSLDSIRSSLRCELAKLATPVLIVIDDIDRLTKDEMRLLVQLVKVNVDFPNVVYLLLYQKNILTDALHEPTGAKGQSFLKKIVQIELEVPMAPEYKLRGIFLSQIEGVLRGARYRWDKPRWDYVFENGIWPCFQTLRDIKRFIGAFEFYFESHIMDGVLQVNPIDLLILETLRMFDPAAYQAVSQAFQRQDFIVFAHLMGPHLNDGHFSLNVQDLLDRQQLSADERECLRALLFDLFPQASGPEISVSGNSDDWKRDWRICHPDNYRRYFQIGGEPGDVTAAFISKLFHGDNDREKLQALLEQKLDSGGFTALLDHLHIAHKDLPRPLIEPFITALFDISDRLPTTAEGVFVSSAEQRLSRLAIALLSRIQVLEGRTATLQHAISNSRGITGPSLCLRHLQHGVNDGQGMRPPTVDPGQYQAILAEWLPRLWESAKSGTIWNLKDPSLVIDCLRKWAGEGDVRAWLSTAIKAPKVAVAFLRSMLHKGHISDGRGCRTVYSLLGAELESLVSLESLAACAPQDSRDPLEMAALERLREAISRKGSGEPYAAIYVMSRNENGDYLTDYSDASV